MPASTAPDEYRQIFPDNNQTRTIPPAKWRELVSHGCPPITSWFHCKSYYDVRSRCSHCDRCWDDWLAGTRKEGE